MIIETHEDVTRAVLGDYAQRSDGSFALEFSFVLEAGEASMPKEPITGKAAAGYDCVGLLGFAARRRKQKEAAA